jgi:hypothetical protein
MKYNKIVKALSKTGVVCAILASSSAFAADETYTFGFTTVADVAVAEITELNFGGQLALAGGTVCQLNVGNAVADLPSESDAKIANGSSVGAGTNYANLVGVGCGSAAGTDGVPGVFEITGASGVEVDVTLTSQLAGTNFNFVPNGVGVFHDGNATNGDTFVPITAGAAATLRLANLNDLLTNTGSAGVPSVGNSLFFVGGTATVTTTLLAGTEYTETFGVEVVYK